jgi:AAHS family 4-hydroxybenzoate transporter-like MFS transporter
MNNSRQDNYIEDLIARTPMTPYQVILVVLCFILNMNDGIDVLVVSYTNSKVFSEWLLTKTQQGYIFSFGLAGMTLGCLLIAPLADRIGRRKLFIYAMSLETLGMLLSSTVTSYYQLLAFRFMAGLGIGGLLPTMAAIASEYSSDRRKDLAVGFVQAGYPIGATFMGFYAAWAVPLYGWRFAYFSAGIFSGAMLLMILFFMPESIDYLSKHQPQNALQRINRILARMGHEKIDSLPSRRIIRKPGVRTLFSDQYRASTIRLFIGIFFGFMTLYTLLSWVPSVAEESGMPYKMATYAGTVLNVGAFIGCVAIGWLTVKFNLRKLMFTFLIVAFLIMVAYGNFSPGYLVILIMILLIGISVQGGFIGYYPAATRIYETEIRATGVGWAIGAGRFGAIAGPALFGILSDLNLSNGNLFILFSIPLLISGFAIYTVPSKNLK